MILILDIDSTIADNSHRMPKSMKGRKLTKQQMAQLMNPVLIARDKPIANAQEALRQISSHFSRVIFVTGRQESFRELTRGWLEHHFGFIASFVLLMRPDDNKQSASDCKIGLFDTFLKQHPSLAAVHDILFIDDDPYVLNRFASYSSCGLALKAPECWPLLIHPKPKGKEPLRAR